MKSKLKAILKMELSDRQRRILIAEDVLGIYGVERISAVTGISINHVYAESKVMKESQVRSTYLVLTEHDILTKDLHVDSNETITNMNADGDRIPPSKDNTNVDVYSNDYIDIYTQYPKKTDKRRGEKVFKSLIKNGYSKSFLLQCVQNYLDSGGNNRVRDRDPNYIKSLAVFLGPDRHFLEYSESSEPSQPPPEPFIDEDNSISNLLV